MATLFILNLYYIRGINQDTIDKIEYKNGRKLKRCKLHFQEKKNRIKKRTIHHSAYRFFKFYLSILVIRIERKCKYDYKKRSGEQSK